MAEEQEKITALIAKLELLLKKQQDFNIEVNEIRRDIQILRNTQAVNLSASTSKPTTIPEEAPSKIASVETPETVAPIEIIAEAKVPQVSKQIEKTKVSKQIKIPKGKTNLEKFIGENLINKIGILILIIGVAIGAKYSIENNLISPLTRIILGYLVGLGLFGFGFKLKAKYENYSAVLVSGALAIMYFITFAAYDLYGLFPQSVAFIIMLLCTVFGVVASLNYNKQVIAHIGLVGAYAVPFLLSNDSGNVLIMFSYVAIINIGILVISFKKYWKALYYISFGFTWLIYAGWCINGSPSAEFKLAFSFLVIFFYIFYVTFIAYKVLKSAKFNVGDIILLVLNSFLFYGLGLYLLSELKEGDTYLGIFTIANAIIHFLVTVFIYKRRLADKKLFYLCATFVLTFITIAVPVQLDGNWVTLIWMLEAALLFWVGRTKKIIFYENLSYILVSLAVVSLSIDWTNSYPTYSFTINESTIQPFLNTTLLTSLLCVAAFGFMNWIQLKHDSKNKSAFANIITFGLPALLIGTLYFAFYLEIEYFWNLAFEASKLNVPQTNTYLYPEYNYALNDFGSICKLIYTVVFITALSFINSFKIKNRILGIITLTASIIVVFFFLTAGLYTLSELRASYINQNLVEYYDIGTSTIYLRYIAIAFFTLLMFSIFKLVKQEFMKVNFKIPFELLLHTSILWILSSELLNWMDLAGSNQSYKLGLSILWGVYALLLIILGIWKQKAYLRIGAISLFSLTLIKLFFYDIASLNTISKTIVFVSLGILLLIISFLYNKFKNKIAGNDKD